MACGRAGAPLAARALRSGALIAPAIAVVACSALTSTDGLVGPATAHDDAAGVGDGGAEAGDAAASSDADGNAPPFCASHAADAVQPAFCADFDDAVLPLGGWAGLTIQPTGAGNALADDRVASSPPFSLLATVVADATAGSDLHAFLFRELSGPSPSRFEIRWKMRVDAPEVSPLWVAVSAHFTDVGGATYTAAFDLAYDRAALEENLPTANAQQQLLAYPPAGQWASMGMVVDFTAPAHVDVTMGGASIGTKAILAGAHSGKVRFDVGVAFVRSPSPALGAHFDDVLVTVQ